MVNSIKSRFTVPLLRNSGGELPQARCARRWPIRHRWFAHQRPGWTHRVQIETKRLAWGSPTVLSQHGKKSAVKLYVQGLAHEQLGQYPEAVQVYEEALALNPKLALSVGWVQWLSGSRQSSRMQPVIPLRLMKRKAPREIAARRGLGTCFM